MSTSYSSSLIVGIPLKNLYKAEVRTEEKTKYNEDTGKPYSVQVKRLYATFGNKTLPPVEKRNEQERYSRYSSYRDEFYQDWDFLEKEGLEVHLPSSEGYCDQDYVTKYGIVGVSLHSSTSRQLEMDEDYAQGTTPEEITDAYIRVKAVIAKFGYTGDIGVFSQLSWG